MGSLWMSGSGQGFHVGVVERQRLVVWNEPIGFSVVMRRAWREWVVSVGKAIKLGRIFSGK